MHVRHALGSLGANPNLADFIGEFAFRGQSLLNNCQIYAGFGSVM